MGLTTTNQTTINRFNTAQKPMKCNSDLTSTQCNSTTSHHITWTVQTKRLLLVYAALSKTTLTPNRHFKNNF